MARSDPVAPRLGPGRLPDLPLGDAMTDHDDLCPLAEYGHDVRLCPYCPVIAKARADEREKIARAIERRSDDTYMTAKWHEPMTWKAAMENAAAIARGER